MSLPGSTSRRISLEVQAKIEAAEPPRERKRKPKDAETFASLIDTITANLLRFNLLQREEGIVSGGILWIGVYLARRHLGARRPYERAPVPQWSRTKIIEAMDRLKLLILDKAPRHPDLRRPSLIRPGPALIALIEQHKPTLADFTEAPGSELIWLRDKPADVESELVFYRVASRQAAKTLDYRDTAQTRKWRCDLERVNAWIASAEITYASDTSDVALHERQMHRVFNLGSFRAGGRLAGPAFWFRMRKADRLRLRIATASSPDGEPLYLLDFVGMFLQLAYAMKARAQMPPDDPDPYAGIIPWSDDPVEKAQLRAALKRNIAALLFHDPRKGPRKSVAQGTRHPVDPTTGKAITSKYIIPKDISAAELHDRIRRRHPAIAPWLHGSSVGFELMFHESEIMMSVLLRCLEAGVVVLPLHDGLLVPQSQWRVAWDAMQEAFRGHTGGFTALIDGPKAADGGELPQRAVELLEELV